MYLIADSLSWTTFGLAVGGSALAALLLVAIVIYAVRRRAAPASLELALRESTNRVEEMVAELSTALDAAVVDSDRSRQLAEISSTIDVDEVVGRTLEVSDSLLGAHAVRFVIEPATEGEAPFLASAGLTPEESDELPARPLDWRRAHAAHVSYLYPEDEVPEGDPRSPFRTALAVRIPDANGEPIGTLWAFWRTSSEVDRERVALFEEIAKRAGPAIANARRFEDARTLAELDALTGLHNYRYFHDALAREVARAQRYDRRLALVVFDIDDFKAVNDSIGHLAGDSVLAEAAQCVKGAVRGADVACRVGGDEFAVILPESSRTDAEALYRRLNETITSWQEGREALRLSAGIAELLAEDDAVSLFKRADEALYRAKAGGKGQSITAGNGAAPGELEFESQPEPS